MSTLITSVTAFDPPRMEPGFEQSKQALDRETVAMMMARREDRGRTDYP